MSTSPAAAAAAPTPRFSKGSDEPSLSSTLETLLGQGRGWALVNDGEAVERSFKFKTFTKTWGLSDKDLKLALICDALAKDFGEVEVPASEATTGGGEAVSCGIRSLADKAAGTAGDCCTPKK
ncbi:pterin 4 alpha carbinolamine dehydratase [Colletotrichum salicis]|uniref:Pterin 4 alpha carbinolamine dehydratase n=1 Tax=Colletotrichum salicis TaxID=1209931 RepID=A0A135V0Q3_9PEZI|nr:pterin 4 alpha carbinolamine dehydratase [Colletotrichum salicis]